MKSNLALRWVVDLVLTYLAWNLFDYFKALFQSGHASVDVAIWVSLAVAAIMGAVALFVANVRSTYRMPHVTVRPRFKVAVWMLTILMILFLLSSAVLSILIAAPTPLQSNLLDNLNRAWLTILAFIVGLLAGKAL
jgi:uncharacterized membrane protein